MIRRKSVYLVLPKLSSFQYKDGDTQELFLTSLNAQLEFCKRYHLQIKCFAEDMLAVNILHNNGEITWVSVLGDSDRSFLQTNVEQFPAQYWGLSTVKAKETFMKEALVKFKTKKAFTYTSPMDYKIDRLNILNKRVRYITGEILDTEKFVIYFDTSNNYCSQPKITLGDGKIYIYVDVSNNVVSFYLGGIPLKQSDFLAVMEKLV